MEVPAIHVEDNSLYQQTGVDNTAGLNNLEVLRKIDALLGHNLDLSNLTGLALSSSDQAQGNISQNLEVYLPSNFLLII